MLSPVEIHEIAQQVVELLKPQLIAAAAKQLDADQVAEVLGVSKSTVERWTAAGKIPSYTVGRCRRYSLDDVLESAKKNELN